MSAKEKKHCMKDPDTPMKKSTCPAKQWKHDIGKTNKGEKEDKDAPSITA